jgi:GNAT superfamily N-acetyltransferase
VAQAKTKSSSADHTIRVELRVDPKDIKVLWDGLSRYNLQHAGGSGYRQFLVALRSDKGKLVGGILADCYWSWMFIKAFWIDGRLRRKGYGEQIIAMAEERGRKLGATQVWLDTFSWQARPFYEKQGYRLFGQLTDYPKGKARYFLSKRLTGASRRRSPPKPKSSRHA